MGGFEITSDISTMLRASVDAAKVATPASVAQMSAAKASLPMSSRKRSSLGGAVDTIRPLISDAAPSPFVGSAPASTPAPSSHSALTPLEEFLQLAEVNLSQLPADSKCMADCAPFFAAASANEQMESKLDDSGKQLYLQMLSNVVDVIELEDCKKAQQELSATSQDIADASQEMEGWINENHHTGVPLLQRLNQLSRLIHNHKRRKSVALANSLVLSCFPSCMSGGVCVVLLSVLYVWGCICVCHVD